jgi:hypothetical protein
MPLDRTAANVAVAQDPAGNVKPANDKSTERIDGIVATIMVIGRTMVAQEEPQPEYSVFGVSRWMAANVAIAPDFRRQSQAREGEEHRADRRRRRHHHGHRPRPGRPGRAPARVFAVLRVNEAASLRGSRLGLAIGLHGG